MLEKLLALNPKDIDALMTLWKIAETEGRIDDAIDWLEKIPGRSHVESNVQLVRLHLAAEDVDDALDLARELASLHPNNPGVLEAMGRVELARNRKNAAARSFQRIADVFTESSQGYFAQLICSPWRAMSRARARLSWRLRNWTQLICRRG